MKKIILILSLLLILFLSGCTDNPDKYLSNSYYTIEAKLIDYTSTSYTLYRSGSNHTKPYKYGGNINTLSYDIAKTLTKNETYLFDYHSYELIGNVDYLDLISIRNSENITVWSL